MFSVLEPCRTFSLVWKDHKAWLRPTKRKCLQLYYYFLDRQLGLIHVKLQTWFPVPIQVYVNGREWLLRRLHAHGLIAKIPHSRRWRVSLSGRRIMAAALKLREVAYPSLYADAA